MKQRLLAHDAFHSGMSKNVAESNSMTQFKSHRNRRTSNVYIACKLTGLTLTKISWRLQSSSLDFFSSFILAYIDSKIHFMLDEHCAITGTVSFQVLAWIYTDTNCTKRLHKDTLKPHDSQKLVVVLYKVVVALQSLIVLNIKVVLIPTQNLTEHGYKKSDGTYCILLSI